MSEYSKELIELNWKILNGSYSQEDKKNADKFLIEFKNSVFLIDICKQLVDSPEINSKFLGAFFIHQSLREKIIEISDSKAEFLKYRDLIFFELLEKLKNTSPIIIERICYSVSILVAIGIISYWPESIEDIIHYGKLSKENCYFSLIILQNITKELNELQISGKKSLKIKDSLIEKNNLVSDYTILLLENFSTNKNNFTENSNEQKFLNQTLDLIHSWLKLNLNLLKKPNIMKILFSCFDLNNIEIICDIFSETICLSKSAKYYIIHSEYNINTLLEKSDHEEIESIGIIIEFMNSYINENIIYLSNTENNKGRSIKLSKDEKILILSNFANIFSSIFENFVNLLFMKNPLSGKLFSLMFYLLTNKTRKISSKMFMSFNEVKEFINRGYNFNNYELNEKKEFCDFLIKICENIMTNCKLSDICIPALVNGKNLNSVDDIDIIDPNDNNALDSNDILLSEYRKQAEEIFYDIFMVFLKNFNDEGVNYFFSFLYNILDKAEINNISKLSSNDERIYIIEVILLLINSIIGCFEVTEIYTKYLIEFTNKIFNSQIIQSEKLMCPFLKFIDYACPYIPKDNKLFLQCIQLFTEILKIKQFENISSLILLQITEFSSDPSVENFNYLYNIYLTKYDDFSNYTLGNFVEILANTIGIREKEENNEINPNKEVERFVKYSIEEISQYFKIICQPANERLQKTYGVLIENINNNNLSNENIHNFHDLIEKIKSSLLRNFHVYNLILKKSYFLSNKILINIFYDLMGQISEIFDKSMRFFINDTNFIKEISKIFLKLTTNINLETLPYFNYFNELMLYLYLNNPENYYCLNVLKPLYSNAANNCMDKKKYLSENFLELSECIKKNILEYNKSNKLDIIIILSQLWTTVINSVDYLNIKDENLIYSFIDFILEAFKSVSEPEFNKTIMKLITNLISSSNIISPNIIFNKYKEIVYCIYSSLDNLAINTISQLISLTKNLINFNQNLFVESFAIVLNNSVNYQKLKPNQKQTLVEYLTSVSNTENKLKIVLNELINLSKGINESDFIVHCEIELAMMKRKK